MSAEKFESSPDLESGAVHIDGAPLTRENTAITLSNDQYERLFFQPSKPQRGDAAKRFGTLIRMIERSNDEITNEQSSQPEFTRPPRFPHPIHLYNSHTMPIPGRLAALQLGRSHCRLLLPRIDCDGDRRDRRVHSRKQCVPTASGVALP